MSDTEEVKEPAAPAFERAKLHWWQRPTIRALHRREREGRDYTESWDQRDNDESRLPDGESVHLAGLVLAEAFTPSTISNLYSALDRLPVRDGDRTENWRERLVRSRTVSGGGWQNLGVLRRPGEHVFGMGGTTDLPPGVSAVWLSLHYELPSAAVLVATFTLEEEAGDLSQLLREDYRTQYLDTRIKVYGALARTRERIPWARPARHGFSAKVSPPRDQKRRASEAVMRRHEDACLGWFEATFRGRFAEADRSQRPSLRLMVTETAPPFEDRRSFLEPVGLDWSLEVWRSPSTDEGWAFSLDRWAHRDGPSRFLIVMAASRKQAAREQNGEDGQSNWYLTQRLASDQSALVSRYTLWALVNLYADRLAELRDAAGARRAPRRPVTEAKVLDDYLSRDGLDVATISADLRVKTQDARIFSWQVPPYVEDRKHLRPEDAAEDPLYFSEALRRRLQEQVTRLELDSDATTKMIRASAELRQAIANTVLQRIVLAVSALALAVAVISAVISTVVSR